MASTVFTDQLASLSINVKGVANSSRLVLQSGHQLLSVGCILLQIADVLTLSVGLATLLFCSLRSSVGDPRRGLPCMDACYL